MATATLARTQHKTEAAPMTASHYELNERAEVVKLGTPEWKEITALSIAVGLEQMRRGMGSTTREVWEDTKRVMGWK